MKLLKKLVIVLFVVFIIAQFFKPEKNVGDMASMDAFYTETNPPAEIKRILQVSCNDCHSDVSKYPWYNNITPVNYWLAEHINDGKKHFNISKWDGNSIKRKDHKFEELIEMVDKKEMPLESYTWTHADAKLTDAEINAMIDWAKQVRLKYSLKPKPE
jgi:hypothetical protein